MERKVASFDPLTAQAQRERAAAATLARLEQDLRRADWRIRPHLEEIRERLFTPGLTAEKLLAACPGDRAFVTVSFHSQVGDSVWAYVTKARLETGSRLLRDTELRVGDISNLLGYSDRVVFSDAFHRWTSLRPQEFRHRCRLATAAAGPAEEGFPEEELLSLELLQALRSGQLDARRAERVIATLEARAPRPTGGRAAAAAEPGSRPLTERCLAAGMWEMLAALPEAERRPWVRDVIRIDSPAFFHLLGEKIRRRLRRDPPACLELAELALEHLAANEPALGDEVPKLRALAWGWLGNARRPALDFPGAERAFARARQEWRAAGEDRRVEAELCDLEASLRLYQRRTGDALALLDRASCLAQALGDSRLLVSSLLQRVAILAPRGDRSTIVELRLALPELEELDEPALTLVALCDLASAYVVTGLPRHALEILPRALELCEKLEESVTRHQLQWTEGLARQALGEPECAEQRLREARDGLLELGSHGYAAVVALDLGILCCEQGRPREASRLASTAIPVLEGLGLGGEALAAVELLRQAILQDTLTLPVLRQARVCLHEGLRAPAAHGAA